MKCNHRNQHNNNNGIVKITVGCLVCPIYWIDSLCNAQFIYFVSANKYHNLPSIILSMRFLSSSSSSPLFWYRILTITATAAFTSSLIDWHSHEFMFYTLWKRCQRSCNWSDCVFFLFLFSQITIILFRSTSSPSTAKEKDCLLDCQPVSL